MDHRTVGAADLKVSVLSLGGPDDIGSSRRHLVAACEASPRRLGTDPIDLWQLRPYWHRRPTFKDRNRRRCSCTCISASVR